MPFYPSDLLGYLGGGLASGYRSLMPPLAKTEEEERKERERFLAQQQEPEAQMDRALRAEAARIIQERQRAAAMQGPQQAPVSGGAGRQMRYPIDAYGSTPQERIRTIQNMNAAESGGESIMEQSGPPMDMTLTAMNYGVPTYSPQELDIFANRSRYQFQPDEGPDYAHADAHRAQVAEMANRRRALERDTAAQDAATRERQPMKDLETLELMFQQTQNPQIGKARDAAAARVLEQQQSQEIQRRLQMQQQQMRRMPQSSMPVTGQPLSFRDMMAMYGLS